MGEWKFQATPEVYIGEDLFTYINGGAEIYLEYGFRQVLVQEYLGKAGDLVSLEIFEMASFESAYGIYSFKRGVGGRPVNIGTEAQLDDYYLNLWKGNFLVTVTYSGSGKQAQEGLLSLAKAVARKIPVRADKPGLVRKLPANGLKEQSVRFILGPQGLFNSYAFFTKDIFSFKKAVKGDYDAGHSLFILEYPDSQSARQKYAQAKKGFSQNERYREFEETEEVFQVKDEGSRRIFAAVKKEYILILVGGENLASARMIFSGVQ